MGLLFEPCVERVAAGKASGAGLAQLFEMMAEYAENNGETASDLIVTYLEPDDDFTIGKYVPELHLVVRRIEPDKLGETNGS